MSALLGELAPWLVVGLVLLAGGAGLIATMRRDSKGRAVAEDDLEEAQADAETAKTVDEILARRQSRADALRELQDPKR